MADNSKTTPANQHQPPQLNKDDTSIEAAAKSPTKESVKDDATESKNSPSPNPTLSVDLPDINVEISDEDAASILNTVNRAVPVRVPESISIHIKLETRQTARLGDNAEIDYISNIHKIGSSYSGKSPLSGLTFEEEIKFLPSIIGVSPTDPSWNSQVKEYWANISQTVPSTGLKLNIGMLYPNQDAADIGNQERDIEAAKIIEARKNGVRYREVFTERTKLGVPLNISDYILYRYCLRYSRVALHIEDIYLSEKIKFYMYSEHAIRQERTANFGRQRKAMAIYLTVIQNKALLNNVATLCHDLIVDYNSKKSDLEKLSVADELSTQMALKVISDTYPTKFVEFAEDKNLQMKAFIKNCIIKGEIKNIENTDIYTYNGVSVGKGLDEISVFLSHPDNRDVLTALRARIAAFQK